MFKFKIANTVFKLNCDCLEIKKMLTPFITGEQEEFEITLQQDLNFDKKRWEISKQVTRYLFYKKGIIRIHASSIAYKGKAILFLAPSGTGKSTHAYIWHKVLGAEYINDDQPFIDLNDFTVYGSCWAGKHNRFSNTSAKLFAFVIIDRGEQNKIEVLDKKQALKYLYKQVNQYVDNEQREKMLKCMDMLTDFVFYKLTCDVSKNAFLTCYKGLFGEDYEN